MVLSEEVHLLIIVMFVREGIQEFNQTLSGSEAVSDRRDLDTGVAAL